MLFGTWPWKAPLQLSYTSHWSPPFNEPFFFFYISRIYGELVLDYWVFFSLFLILLGFIIPFYYIAYLCIPLSHSCCSLAKRAPQGKDGVLLLVLSLLTGCLSSTWCILTFSLHFMNEWLKKWHLLVSHQKWVFHLGKHTFPRPTEAEMMTPVHFPLPAFSGQAFYVLPPGNSPFSLIC